MSLQGVLHGQRDVITDLVISDCNRFIIVSGKDGRVLVWDFKRLVLIDEFYAHGQAKKPVNNILVVSYPQPILFTCSDDGRVRIYNLDYIQTDDEEEQI